MTRQDSEGVKFEFSTIFTPTERFHVYGVVTPYEASFAEFSGCSVGAWLSDTPRNIKGKGMLWPDRTVLKLLESLD